MKRLLLALLVIGGCPWLAAGCGGDDGAGSCAAETCIRVEIGFGDGTSLDFDHRALCERAGELYAIAARDHERGYEITILWSADYVEQPGPYDLEPDQLRVNFRAPNPGDPQQELVAALEGGQLVFDAVGYTRGDPVSGTFGGQRLQRAGLDVALRDGAFKCQIP